MDFFNRHDGELYAESVPVSRIAAAHGTPCYIYSRATLERHFHAYDQALEGMPHRICYAVKANSNLAVLNVLARLGAGFDIVSGGELERVIRAGGDPGATVFSGVGKQRWEIERALEAGVRCFNVESDFELAMISEVASERGRIAPVSVRVNPDVDAGTHPYISTGLKENKFGVEIEQARVLYRRAAEMPGLEVVGADCHIGSQLQSLDPLMDALERMLALIDALAEDGIAIQHLDMGGGLGVPYGDEQPPSPGAYGEALKERLAGRDLELLLEPGRSIAANAGIMVTRVEGIKGGDEHRFAIVDGAMNDLIRPSLYSAWQRIEAVADPSGIQPGVYDVVGPVCETGDFLGKQRELAIEAGDLLAVRSAGAYGFVMSSNYNTRNRPPEILVDGADVHLVRRRETLEEQLAPEIPLPELGS
ncbi:MULTISPECIES: diaminopimelate decarboxylase [Halomonadaceae]|uniref:Diaminopimelate decarboxylase n=1 Tax=Vreelandella halophila TaxID=86177 RepID=A0A9X4YAI3_9GAMM|nr:MULTISPECIES: diaminopimelate decarboxylase [Halomonas]MYL26169.1 diaminopimelate decarboxylase [Halomonas utahensis]MYL73269.1 diaminopimelate decarboxylase [Halomonas sp. 22501_18_FS]